MCIVYPAFYMVAVFKMCKYIYIYMRRNICAAVVEINNAIL